MARDTSHHVDSSLERVHESDTGLTVRQMPLYHVDPTPGQISFQVVGGPLPNLGAIHLVRRRSLGRQHLFISRVLRRRFGASPGPKSTQQPLWKTGLFGQGYHPLNIYVIIISTKHPMALSNSRQDTGYPAANRFDLPHPPTDFAKTQ